MAGAAQITTDPDKIRGWIEQRGGRPALHEGEGRPAVRFPAWGEQESLRESGWEAFFERFEALRLAFLYQETTPGGEASRFYKFIDRDWIEPRKAA